MVPIALPIASLRTCISKQCCITRYKQPIGELIMTTFVSFIYIATIIGVILPTLGKLINLEEVQSFIKITKLIEVELVPHLIKYSTIIIYDSRLALTRKSLYKICHPGRLALKIVNFNCIKCKTS